jgi:ABC-2 type transport system ATP-binding protein
LTVAVIATQALTRNYGSRRGIEGVALRVEEGALFGFLGPNGAGKTTTIRVLLGFLRPSSGAAAIFGLDCWRRSEEIKKEVGYVPGDLRLPAWFTGKSALSVFGAVRGRDMMTHGRELAEMLALDLSVKVRKMSRGMRQKLGLILAMAHRPRLLVLDEPTSGLDPLMQDRFREHLRKVSRAGTTVFFSSHTLGEVEALCDRVAIVREGKIVADSSLDELRKQAGHEVMIRWRREAPGVPEFLKVEVGDGVWRGTMEGPVERLVEWLAGKGVEDLIVGRPDLETMFKRFYEGRGPSGG